jgi:uncharacterized membrane-anchored protein YitT (DUF2179 family)
VPTISGKSSLELFIGSMIVSDKVSEIRDSLLQENFNGFTNQDNVSGHCTSGPKSKLQSMQLVVNRIDYGSLESMVRKLDSRAFVMQFDVNHVAGGVLRRYLK